jgi:hypothetical protein
MFQIDIIGFQMSKPEVAMNKSLKLSAALLVHQGLGSTVAKELKAGQVDMMRHGKGKHLYCTSGRLWVTLEHRSGDYILEAEQGLDIEENGRVVISALDSGSYRVA